MRGRRRSKGDKPDACSPRVAAQRRAALAKLLGPRGMRASAGEEGWRSRCRSSPGRRQTSPREAGRLISSTVKERHWQSAHLLRAAVPPARFRSKSTRSEPIRDPRLCAHQSTSGCRRGGCAIIPPAAARAQEDKTMLEAGVEALPRSGLRLFRPAH